jgi:hypothetical protein
VETWNRFEFEGEYSLVTLCLPPSWEEKEPTDAGTSARFGGKIPDYFVAVEPGYSDVLGDQARATIQLVEAPDYFESYRDSLPKVWILDEIRFLEWLFEDQQPMEGPKLLIDKNDLAIGYVMGLHVPRKQERNGIVSTWLHAGVATQRVGIRIILEAGADEYARYTSTFKQILGTVSIMEKE